MICKCLSLSMSYAATIGGLTTIIGTYTSLIFLEDFNKLLILSVTRYLGRPSFGGWA